MNAKKQQAFPRAVIIVIVAQACLKFSYNSMRGVLPLYFVDVLHYGEDDATVFYHAFSVFLFTFSLVGGVVADSYLGKFRSIVIFSLAFVVGLSLLSIASVPPFNLPTEMLTILGLVVAAFGFGAVKPCVIAFGGNQFSLPEQEKQLSLLFVLICVASNVGSTSAYFVSPMLRKDITCFGQLTCYSLVFFVPMILLSFMTILILVTKRLYKIQKPESSIVLTVFKCALYAAYKKLTSREKRDHWLDNADDRYKLSLIEDIKSISQILKLLLPLPIFWALYGAQSSIWTFQASRLNGQVAGYVVKPDQIQVANPLFVIILVPIFQSYVYPFLAKFCFVSTPLRRMTLGCFVTALAYYASTILEFNLEHTYAKTPTKGFAQLRIYNTLDCRVNVAIDGEKVNIDGLDMWQNINIRAAGTKLIEYQANLVDCDFEEFPKNTSLQGTFEVKESRAMSWVVSEKGLIDEFEDHVDKSMSGNPLVRTLISVDDDFAQNSLTLEIAKNNEQVRITAVPMKITEYEEINHAVYDLYLNDRLVETSVALKSGGVYTILGRVGNSSMNVRTITVTEPNSLHIMWILPQLFLLSVAEIIVDVSGMDFVYSQAPPSMKSFLQAYWLYMGFFGNLLVIGVTEAHFFDRKVFEFLLYAVMMTLGTVAFAMLASFYKYRQISDDISDESNHLSTQRNELPLEKEILAQRNSDKRANE